MEEHRWSSQGQNQAVEPYKKKRRALCSWLRSHEHGAQAGIYIYDTDGNFSHFSTLRTRMEMVLKTLVFSPFNHLTRLVAREDFIMQDNCLYLGMEINTNSQNQR
jgi:hypothetical protein